MSEPWLGHHDLCSIQWSDVCDCDPHNPIDFSAEPECRHTTCCSECCGLECGCDCKPTPARHQEEGN